MKKQDWSPRRRIPEGRGEQPDWELVANLGDQNPLEYGGYFIYRDKTDVYEDEAALIQPDAETGKFTIWRFQIERLKLVDGYLVPILYMPSWNHPVEKYDQWYHDQLPEVAKTMSTTPEAIEQALISPDPIVRAEAYRDLGDYFGWVNFDAYPLTDLSLAEVKKRYRKELRKIKGS